VIEILLGIVMVVGMARIASSQGDSAVLWGVITFVLTAAAIVLIPLPFARVLIAGAVAFGAMIAANIVRQKA
jgi:hypothetical protein